MAIGMTVNHLWQLPNGYWVPMTAAILLKPDLHETAVRLLNRVFGTIIGAGLTTLLVAVLKPTHFHLGLMLLAAVWACFAMQRVHYALFAMCVTTYVVLLLSALNLPEPVVAWHRMIATLAGAGVAMVAHLVPIPIHREEN